MNKFIISTFQMGISKYIFIFMAAILTSGIGYYIIQRHFTAKIALDSAISRQHKEKEMHKVTSSLLKNYNNKMLLIDKERVSCSYKDCNITEMKNDFKNISD